MAIHPSLKPLDRNKKARSVLKRTERLKIMLEKKIWKEGDDVFGLPKIKTIRIKIKKEKAEKATETAPAIEATPLAPAQATAIPAKGAAKASEKK